MATFTDSSKKDWVIQLDAPAIIKVREDCDPRFMLGDDDENDNTAMRLGDDQVLLCLVIHKLCERQCEAKSIDRETFLREVLADGDTIQAAGEALVAAIVNFTPPRKRKFLEALVKKQKAVEDLAIAKAMSKMDDPKLMVSMEAALDAQMDAALNRLTQPESPSGSQDS